MNYKALFDKLKIIKFEIKILKGTYKKLRNLLSRNNTFIIKVLLVLFFLISSGAFAWEECPFGLINDPYPGECSRYVDTDNDRICDLSQLAPEDVGTLTTPSDIEIKRRVYHLLPITLILIFLYTLSSFLIKKKIISLAIHRKIWNFLLLISFLISAGSGILLVIEINYSLKIISPSNILFFQVEAGIAMTVISVFHIIWHWPYFKKLFRFKKRI